MTDIDDIEAEVCEIGGGEGVERKRYRLITGPDSSSFCERVSAALEDGYVLYGSPSINTNDGQNVVAQAVVLPD